MVCKQIVAGLLISMVIMVACVNAKDDWARVQDCIYRECMPQCSGPDCYNSCYEACTQDSDTFSANLRVNPLGTKKGGN
ncbi:hypothetical protein FRX31_022389 [Thalictrum thalictroides]|uniref:Uncharacterized protein n=1 Tax=Thalictrum thalictroides TaxID=46969 RepID=A0A7J6VV09_THATH|nr:hypothetical protein FRX31_022389 [Thalictrum thalictroides]